MAEKEDKLVTEEAADVSNVKAMSQLRVITYTSDVGEAAQATEIDYSQQDYTLFRNIYNGSSESGMQLGALFAQPIVHFYTAFVIGMLPKVVVRAGNIDSSGKRQEEPELSTFANDFLKAEHHRLVQLVKTTLKLGDCYCAFNPNRTLAIISPETADPGFYLYTERLNSLKQRQTRYLLNPKTRRKNKVVITRTWTRDKVIVEAAAEGGSIDVKEFGKPKLELTHNIGVAPVVLYANNRDDLSAFGWSEFAGCIPFMNMYHRTLARGFEAQQYAGKPVLKFKGIDGPAKKWLKDSFDIDVDKLDDATEKQKMKNFLEAFKMLTLTGENVDAEFLESKFPLGATSEMCQLAFQGIVKMCGVPEFMFGANMESSNAVAREQYVSLKSAIQRKRIEFGAVLKQIIKWAFYWYSNAAVDEETGLPITTYSFASDPAALEQLEVELIWPTVLASDEDIKLEAMKLLADINGLSYEDAFENLPYITADPQTSLNRVREEFNDATLPTKGQSNSGEQRDKRDTSRKSDDKGNAGNNSGRTGRTSGSPSKGSK